MIFYYDILYYDILYSVVVSMKSFSIIYVILYIILYYNWILYHNYHIIWYCNCINRLLYYIKCLLSSNHQRLAEDNFNAWVSPRGPRGWQWWESWEEGLWSNESVPGFRKYTLWLCQNSYWTWQFIVDLPIDSMVDLSSLLFKRLPEGKGTDSGISSINRDFN